MRGKAKVKDWKACVRTWEKNSNNNTQPKYANKQTNSFDLESDEFMNEENFSDKYGVN